jgi:hypothetical protein
MSERSCGAGAESRCRARLAMLLPTHASAPAPPVAVPRKARLAFAGFAAPQREPFLSPTRDRKYIIHNTIHNTIKHV